MNISMFINRVKATIKKRHMLKSVAGAKAKKALKLKVLVAVSGGADSMALLNVLYRLKDELNFSLHVCHLNHQFRGSESDEDQRFVISQSQKLGLPISSQSLKVYELIKKMSLSVQDGARRIRYEYFQKVAAEIKADKIALGHTLDDQAETILMRLLRGSGSQGLSGIPPQRDKYIRPLIDVNRNEIMEYLNLENIPFREDSSNKRSIYLRNKVRLSLIPLIEESYNPNFKSTLCRISEILDAEDEFLNRIVERKLNEFVLQSGEKEVHLNAKKLSQCHIALQRRILRKCIEKLKRNMEDISFEHIESALKLLKSKEASSKIPLPRQLEIVKEYDKIIIKISSRDSNFNPFDLELKTPGDTRIEPISLNATTQLYDIKDINISKSSGDGFHEFFDADKISSPLRIRNRKNGDRFLPLGMPKGKKLKDFFIDEKVPKPNRDQIPLLVDQKNILWVVGYRMSDVAKVTAETKRVLKVSVQTRR